MTKPALPRPAFTDAWEEQSYDDRPACCRKHEGEPPVPGARCYYCSPHGCGCDQRRCRCGACGEMRWERRVS
jgi:hypothetical protein